MCEQEKSGEIKEMENSSPPPSKKTYKNPPPCHFFHHQISLPRPPFHVIESSLTM
jgi:hypothetical protein